MISVLMSVYNESKAHIMEAVDSCLNQTYKDFELIIVNDNPENEDIREILNGIKAKDSRIVIVNNKKNMGLAMSLNEAAKAAKGEIFARMDADDISEPDRFQMEYDLIMSGKYDLITTNYHFIDENSVDMDDKVVVYSEKAVSNLLPYGNTIHHPTVMMTREIFEKVNGYRNFPCAQDYDLWLRMYDNGARMFMIDKDLFRYRVRRQSITVSKKMKQIATMQYSRELYRQRKRTGRDNYSIENYNRYLEKNGVFDQRKEKKFNDLHAEGRKMKSASFVEKIGYYTKVLFTCPFLAKVYMQKVRFLIMKKKIS